MTHTEARVAAQIANAALDWFEVQVHACIGWDSDWRH